MRFLIPLLLFSSIVLAELTDVTKETLSGALEQRAVGALESVDPSTDAKGGWFYVRHAEEFSWSQIHGGGPSNKAARPLNPGDYAVYIPKSLSHKEQGFVYVLFGNGEARIGVAALIGEKVEVRFLNAANQDPHGDLLVFKSIELAALKERTAAIRNFQKLLKAYSGKAGSCRLLGRG